MVTCDYAQSLLTYELRIWTPYRLEDEREGSAVYGDNGYIILGHDRWRTFDAAGKWMREETGSHDDVGHVRDFLDCVRSRGRCVADLETLGHPSSLLCHLGNVVWKAGRTLRFDAERRAFMEDDQANQFLTRPQIPFSLDAAGDRGAVIKVKAIAGGMIISLLPLAN